MSKVTKSDVMKYCELAGTKGLLNSNTASSWKATVNRVLELVAEDDDVSTLDVHGAVLQYNNRRPGVMSPDSLRTYEVRLGRAIEEATRYVADPAKYKAPSATVAKPKKPPSPAPTAMTPSTSTDVVTLEEVRHGDSRTVPRYVTDASLAMPFPLRPGFLAQVVIPRDLTQREADRLGAFIQTLAQSESDDT